VEELATMYDIEGNQQFQHFYLCSACSAISSKGSNPYLRQNDFKRMESLASVLEHDSPCVE
jgi:hypothetical protein